MITVLSFEAVEEGVGPFSLKLTDSVRPQIRVILVYQTTHSDLEFYHCFDAVLFFNIKP